MGENLIEALIPPSPRLEHRGHVLQSVKFGLLIPSSWPRMWCKAGVCSYITFDMKSFIHNIFRELGYGEK